MVSIHVLITGSDDLASATALRLFRAGFKVTLFVPNRPIDIHHTRTFSSAVYNGEKTIDEVVACTRSGSAARGDSTPETDLADFIEFTYANRQIPILTEEDLVKATALPFEYIFAADAGLFGNLPVRIKENSVIISKKGDNTASSSRYEICVDPVFLGQVLYPFNRDDFMDCGVPETTDGSKERVKAPLEGVFTTDAMVDTLVHEKQELGRINDIPILSPVSGKISGLLNSGMIIPAGTVFAEISSVTDPHPPKRISPASFSVAGAVLEAIMFDLNLNK